jgi:hypothetical protein
MKTILSLFLIALLFCLSGCMLTSKVVDKAHGYSYADADQIYPSQIKKGDKVGIISARSGWAYVIQYPKDKDNSKEQMPVIPPYYSFYICRPHPAYYLLVPLTVPADIIIFPYGICWWLSTDWHT